MIRQAILFIVLIFCAPFAGNADAAGRKVALIIANAHYQNTSALKNPANDAAIIADALNADHFTVVNVQMDLDAGHFRAQLKQFSNQARDADVALIYYAGHGILSNGNNWLIPVDAVLKSEDDLDLEAVNLENFMFAIQDAKVRIAIIDACRDNPFRRGWISPTRAVPPVGLGEVHFNGEGELVIFSAAPGQEAQDGNGINSPFAQALARRLVQPELAVQLLGNAIRDDVLNATNKQQRPYSNNSLSMTMTYLADQGAALPGLASGAGSDAESVDMLSWKSAMRADTLEAYSAYRDSNPNGHFVKMAAANIKRLEAVRAASQPAAAMRNFSADDAHSATEQLNALAKQQFDQRDNAQADVMKAYREQVEEMARSAAAMRDEYARKVNDFDGQQARYEADQKAWMARADACRRGNVKECADAAHSAPVAPAATVARTWPEALIVCRVPTGAGEARSDCQGPVGDGDAVLGTRDGEKLLLRLCDDAPDYRDLGVVKGMRVYGCGFGLNPYLPPAKKGNLDVAAALDLQDVPGRQTYRCADQSKRQCRTLADAKPE